MTWCLWRFGRLAWSRNGAGGIMASTESVWDGANNKWVAVIGTRLFWKTKKANK